jgi:multiple sugar transport system substrate-binding protein
MERGKLSRREFMNLSAVTAAGALLAACGPGEPAEEAEPEMEEPEGKVTINFWSDLVGSKEEGRAGLIAAYNAASDSAEVVHEGIFGQDEAHQKFLTALAGGVVPNLYGNGSDLIPGYVENDALTDLGPFLEKSDSVSEVDFPEGVLALCKHDGKVWGIPVYADTMVLYYNRNLMEEAGFDPEVPPRDWDELREMANAIVKRDANGDLEVAGCLWGNWSAPRVFIPGVYAFGGKLFNDDLTKAAFNSPEGRDALQVIVDMIQEDEVTEVGWGEEFEDSVTEPFIAEKAGFQFDVPAATRRIVRWRPEFTEYGIVGLPAGPAGYAQIAQTIALMIPEKATLKEESWRFIEYWMQPKVMVRWAQDIFRPPSTFAALQDEALMADPRIAPVSEALEYTVGVPSTPHWAEVFNAISAEVQLAIIAEKTVEQALTDAETNVNRVLELG